MRVLQLIPSFALGGAEVFTANLVNELLKNEKINIVICIYSGKGMKNINISNLKNHENVKLIDLNCEFKYLHLSHVILLFKLFRLINKYKPDIIHTHLACAIELALLYPFLDKKIKLVHTAHSQAYYELGSNKKTSVYFLLRKFYYSRKRVKVVSISNSVKDSIDNLYAIDSKLILNGTNEKNKTHEYDKTLAKINLLKKNNKGAKVFLAVGNNRPEKNYKLLINVFQKLYSENANVLLIILGDTQSKNSNLTNLQQQNIFFWGTVANVQDFMLISDFLCVSSLFEGLPIAIIEAMSLKLLPIVTPVPGIVDIIKHEYNGLIAQQTDEDSFYKMVLYALNLTNEKKNIMIENGYKDFCFKYHISISASNYYNYYKESNSTLTD